MSAGLDWIRISGSWIWTGLDLFNSIRPVARRVQWVQLHPLRVHCTLCGPIAPSAYPLHPLALRFAPYVHNIPTDLSAKLCCTAAPRLLIFSSLDGTSSVRLKLCCTAAPRLLIFSSLDGTSSVRLKLCCTAAPRLLIFSSVDGSSCVRLNLSFYLLTSSRSIY